MKIDRHVWSTNDYWLIRPYYSVSYSALLYFYLFIIQSVSYTYQINVSSSLYVDENGIVFHFYNKYIEKGVLFSMYFVKRCLLLLLFHFFVNSCLNEYLQYSYDDEKMICLCLFVWYLSVGTLPRYMEFSVKYRED